MSAQVNTDTLFEFPIPPSPRSFELFGSLPTEIRHTIWELCVRVPGMHFLRLVPRFGQDPLLAATAPAVNQNFTDGHETEDSDSEGEESDEFSLETDDSDDESDTTPAAPDPAPAPQQQPFDPFKDGELPGKDVLPEQTWRASLAPMYPTAKADLSYYVTLNQQMARLSVTCADARRAMQHLELGRDVLKLPAANGRLVSLDSASDVVFLEYISQDLFERGCPIPFAIDCPDLDIVRKVAVRYCHGWESLMSSSSGKCGRCGIAHDRDSKRAYPVHVVQLLARHLPKLEAVYLVDYLILRNTHTLDPAVLHKKQPELEVFKSGGRTYFEVDPHSYRWKVQCRIFETLGWLKRSFRKYASRSKTSQHGTPRKVEFKVLACEWETTQPRMASAVVQTARNVASRYPRMGHKPPRPDSNTPAGKKSSRFKTHRSIPEVVYPSWAFSLPMPVPRFDSVGYHFGDGLRHEFSFRCERSSM